MKRLLDAKQIYFQNLKQSRDKKYTTLALLNKLFLK